MARKSKTSVPSSPRTTTASTSKTSATSSPRPTSPKREKKRKNESSQSPKSSSSPASPTSRSPKVSKSPSPISPKQKKKKNIKKRVADEKSDFYFLYLPCILTESMRLILLVAMQLINLLVFIPITCIAVFGNALKDQVIDSKYDLIPTSHIIAWIPYFHFILLTYVGLLHISIWPLLILCKTNIWRIHLLRYRILHTFELAVIGAMLTILALLVVSCVLQVTIQKDYDDEISKKMNRYGHKGPETELINRIQRDMECCGARQYQDWSDAPIFSAMLPKCHDVSSRRHPFIPHTCCSPNSDYPCQQFVPEKHFNESIYSSIEDPDSILIKFFKKNHYHRGCAEGFSKHYNKSVRDLMTAWSVVFAVEMLNFIILRYFTHSIHFGLLWAGNSNLTSVGWLLDSGLSPEEMRLNRLMKETTKLKPVLWVQPHAEHCPSQDTMPQEKRRKGDETKATKRPKRTRRPLENIDREFLKLAAKIVFAEGVISTREKGATPFSVAKTTTKISTRKATGDDKSAIVSPNNNKNAK